jgi:hypothetical protein
MAQLEVADVFRKFSASYLEAFGETMLPSHRRALEDIMACRTPAMGGQVYRCGNCERTFYAYHGCRNRSCPACHTDQTRRWLGARCAELLPCAYYHVCVTVPEQLRETLRANQRDGYALLMKAASAAVLELCADQRRMGATPAVLSVLHTWTAAMQYHPHVHLLVSGGGLGADGKTWREAAHPFLLPVHALSKLVRGKFMALLKKACPDLAGHVAADVWKRPWVTWCKPWGKGETAVLDYLARYVHRIAIANARILAMDGYTVTFRYKDRKAGVFRICTVSGHEFMRRFLQHVLPKGFHKVRYSGLWHASRRAQRQNVRNTLQLRHTPKTPPPAPGGLAAVEPEPAAMSGDHPSNPPCPHCGGLDTKCIGTVLKEHKTKPARASPRRPQ